jgi:hypothetical protein
MSSILQENSSHAQRDSDPSSLMKLSTAYWDSQTLLTANRIGLFQTLADQSMDTEAIAELLGTKPRPTKLLLKACVALGLLEETGGQFRNSPLSANFLVPGSKGYMGNAIRYSDNLYNTWGNLESALREDRPPMMPDTYLGKDPAVTKDFVYGMHDRALGIGKAMLEMVDLSGYRQLLDIGGGPGTYSALFTLRYPNLNAKVLDLPDVVAIAEEIVISMGAADKVTTIPGSYMETDFPRGNDVVLISGVFHRESPQTCRELIHKAAEALETGGLLIISDVFTDAGGSGPLFATLFGLNMMLTAVDGGVHSDADVSRWMQEAGFVETQSQSFPPPMPHRIVCCKKR